MKRYLFIIASVLLAIALDAIIFVGLLDTPWGRVPTAYHIINIIFLSCGIAVLGDRFFNVGVLR
ncbi:MAG: hypothetical protein J5I90_13405 [Caldilineales bacterium]|nr:hypothetical protein [Caldilineales bacterium]